MKWLSNRISFHRHDEYTTILISTQVEKWKESLLFAWSVLWSLIGVAVLVVIFSPSYLSSVAGSTPKNQLLLFLLMFLVFWGYYLYKSIKVYLWRKKGVEYIKIDKDQLVIKKGIGNYGRAKSYPLSTISKFQELERSTRSYSWVMQSAFWDIGNESIEFQTEEKTIRLGVQLEEKETKELLKFLTKELALFKRKNG